MKKEPLGMYIYMGMGWCNNHTVCLSVGYNEDYAVKKALQFEASADGVVVFKKIHKIRVGELERVESVGLSELRNKYLHIFKEYAKSKISD